PTTVGGVGGGELNRAQQQLQRNSNLREKVESRLPAGMDVMAAASDFRNLGQFMAAVNVSNNLGLDFLALKALMTGPEQLSLGQAIQRLKGLDTTTASARAATAEAQATAQVGAAGPIDTTGIAPSAGAADGGAATSGGSTTAPSAGAAPSVGSAPTASDAPSAGSVPDPSGSTSGSRSAKKTKTKTRG
ncbi:MAG TPA: hypothetical protein VFO85_07055, partial [Vicinamibacteria bacterium]|nr:hypothetical protein [Vicinamibacteria bacterium]